ncbi:MAG: FHA domain-containing protein [Verrucomicrobiota bacterium]
MSLKLVVKSQATCEPNELILSEGSYGIGRMHDNALSIQHDGISGYHAELTQTSAGAFTIQDLHSTNGTFLNGEQVSSPKTVQSGDLLSFGNIEVAVEPHAVSVLASDSGPEESSLVLVSLKEHIPFEGEDSYNNNTYPIAPMRASQPTGNPVRNLEPSAEAEAVAPESAIAIEGIELAKEEEDREALERERATEQARQMEQEREVERARQIEREREIEQARQIEQEREIERARQIEREKEIAQAKQIEREKEAEQARQVEREKEAEKVTISQLQKQIAEFKSAFEQLETTKQTLMQSNLELKQQVEAAKVAIQRSAENEAKLRQNYATVVEKWKKAESRSAPPVVPVPETGPRSPESVKALVRRSAPTSPGLNPNRDGGDGARPIHQSFTSNGP